MLISETCKLHFGFDVKSNCVFISDIPVGTDNK